MSDDRVPSSARFVVIGGGIMGCSTAYHLAKLAAGDVLLVERSKLTSGTTWHSAAQVRQLRSTRNLTELIRYSVELYRRLEDETEQATGWRQSGSLSIATTADRLTHIRRQAALARAYGVEAHEIDVAEAKRLWPLMRTDDLIGAVFSPGDGRVDPSNLCTALAKGARTSGARIVEDTPVTGIEIEKSRVSAVLTARGRIACEAVAICAGMWSREVAALAGVAAPLYACEHFCLLTKPIAGVDAHLPTLGDHDAYLYARDEVGGLMVGCFEPRGKPLALEDLPKDFSFDLLNEDWDHFEPMMLNALHRFPTLEAAEVRMLLNGPESFTPDGSFLLGAAPEVGGVYLACGMNSVGVATGGGAGQALAEWMCEGQPTMDLWPVDPRRFAPAYNRLSVLRARAPETLGLHYAIAYPGREHETARDLMRTPLHARLAARGACFGEHSGWERPSWFNTGGAPETVRLTFERPDWFENVAAEHRAAREAVALIDQSTLAKLLVEGPGAERVLQRLCANDMAVRPGRIVYTPMLNARGGYESDMTVMRLSADAFLVITGTAQPIRDADWIRRHLDQDAGAAVADVTADWATLAVTGPSARDLLIRLSPDDLSNDAFPYYSWREIEVAGLAVRAARLSYAGELGWEVHVPASDATRLYDALVEAGEPLGLLLAGTYALTSLRVEKGCRAWGHDLTPDDTPFEAGLGFTVKLDKGCNFIGREALIDQRERGVRHRLVVVTLDDPAAWPMGGEPILRHGRPVGEVTSAAYGHSVGRAVAMGYVPLIDGDPVATLAKGGFALDIAGVACAATASLTAPYDPEARRVRG